MSEPEYVSFAMQRTEGTIYTPGERVAGLLLTKKRAAWLRGFLQAVGEGHVGDAALIRGGKLAGMRGVTRVGELEIKRRMEGFLSNPDVQQAIRNVYEAAAFTLEDAVGLHIKHIKGEITEQKVTKDGDVVDVKLAPNYGALKDFLIRATPQAPARMHVLTARVGAPREIRTDGSPPPMAARAIGETHEAG